MSELSEGLGRRLTVEEETASRVRFRIEYSGACFDGCRGVTESYELDQDGLTLSCRLLDPSGDRIFVRITVINSNGTAGSVIANNGRTFIVELGGHRYRIEPDELNGTFIIGEHAYGNRNGEYAMALLEAKGPALSVHLQLE